MRTKSFACFCCVLLAGALATQAQKTASGVIAHWSFDEEVSGGEHAVKDSGPNKLDGRIRPEGTVGIRRTAGIKGTALEFVPGGGAWVELAADSVLDLEPPFTICAWVKSTTVGSMDVVSRKWDSAPGGYRLRCVGNRLCFDMGNESEEMRLFPNEAALQADRWAHIAATFDGIKLRLFANGQEVGSKETGLKPSARFEGKRVGICLGNYVGAKDAYPFVGLLDEVMIFAKALTAQELAALAADQSESARKP